MAMGKGEISGDIPPMPEKICYTVAPV